MGSDTVSTSNDEGELALTWSRHWTLAHRILALNLLTVLLVALSTLYLDVFRNSLSIERVRQTRIEATTTAEALAHMPRSEWPTFLAAISRSSQNRLRLYGNDGRLLVDSWRLTGPTYALLDPKTLSWTQNAARALDRAFNFLVGAEPLGDYVEPPSDKLQAWPEAVQGAAPSPAGGYGSQRARSDARNLRSRPRRKRSAPRHQQRPGLHADRS